jgi:hypothetical protein
MASPLVWLPFTWLVLSLHGLRLDQRGKETRARYIFLISGDEGMGSWRESIAELMVLSKQTGSVFVVPCIGGGRLIPCYADNAKYTLTDYFDEGSLQGAHDKWITYDEFMQDATTNNLSASIWCAHAGSPPTGCQDFDTSMHASKFNEWTYTSKWGVNLADVQNIWGAHDILAIYMYRKWAFGIPEQEKAAGLSAMRFSKALQADSERFASKLGLQVGFTAIQWRSETVGQYKICSDFLERFANNHTLLISDISIDPNKLLWDGMGLHSSQVDEQQQSLTSLFERGIRKLDQLPEINDEVSDIGMISLLDLLLGAQAGRFYTCIDGSGICETCMRRGSNFARDIINERQQQHKTSYTSWEQLGTDGRMVNIEDGDCPAETAPDFTLSICRKYQDEVGVASGEA